MWQRVQADDVSKLRAQGIVVHEGVPCLWCDELIKSMWTEHAYVAQGSTAWKDGKEIKINPPKKGLFCDCPHCNRTFQLRPK